MKESVIKLFSDIKNTKDLETLLNVTFTEKELEMIIERWQIFQSIDQGLTQRAVAKENNCSVVTVTRGAKVYRENQISIKKHLKKLFNESN